MDKGYEVHGLVRRSSSFNTGRIDHVINNALYENRFFFHHGDVTDASNLNRLLEKIRPDEIYNLAAQSHVKVSFDLPDYTAQVDALGTLRFLMRLKKRKLEPNSIKLLPASCLVKYEISRTRKRHFTLGHHMVLLSYMHIG